MSFVRYSKAINPVSGELLAYHQQAFERGANVNTAGIIRSAGKNYYDPGDGSLAGAWLLDERKGRLCYDISPNNRHLYWNPDSLPAWHSDGVDFSQSTDALYDELGDDTFQTAGTHTIMGWFYPHDSSYDMAVGYSKSDSVNRWFLYFRLGYIQFYAQEDNGSTEGTGMAADHTAYTVNQWVHVAVSWTTEHPGIMPLMYKNGVVSKIGTKTPYDYSYTHTSSHRFMIGDTASGHGFDGVVARFAFYNRILKPAEIYNDYAAGIYHTPEALTYAV